MQQKCTKQVGTIPMMILIGSTIAGIATLLGLSAAPFLSGTIVDMRTEPKQGMLVVGENITIDIVVESNTPVNAFAGEVLFNNDVLQVQSIDYNTSIADLWAERPWYSNGDGNLVFAGGTTKKGGFTGEGKLITITFKTVATGAGNVAIENARILMHDGLGTDAQLAPSIDALFTVSSPEDKQSEVLSKSTRGTDYVVTKDKPSTDLNDDGKQTVADVSIFMIHLASGNTRSDFNEDGKVNTADLSIILNAE